MMLPSCYFACWLLSVWMAWLFFNKVLYLGMGVIQAHYKNGPWIVAIIPNMHIKIPINVNILAHHMEIVGRS